MKKNQEPKEMEPVGGGLNPGEMKRLWGARCVCSSGSASYYKDGDVVCQCDFGNDNAIANARIAAT